jgi:hypothetical protein
VKPAASLGAAVAAAGIASAAYQRIADEADRRRYLPPGMLADIGGRRIHLLAKGEGSQTVVIVPALGDNVLQWVRVQRVAATTTTVGPVQTARAQSRGVSAIVKVKGPAGQGAVYSAGGYEVISSAMPSSPGGTTNWSADPAVETGCPVRRTMLAGPPRKVDFGLE